MSITLYRYRWTFGDGKSSDQKSPVHTYRMPGKYNWTLKVWDQYGNQVTTRGTVYVYDWDQSLDDLHVADTNLCYRSAVKGTQGRGIVPYTGDYWVYPTAYTGTCKGYDSSNNAISLVCNNRNGRFYRIGIPEVWEDRIDDYGGYPIESRIRMKERTAVAGEYQEIEHVESHAHLRPWKEEYRNESGYDSEGFSDDHAVTISVYENGEPTTASATLEDIPRYGDYVFRRRIEARRLQLELEFAAAPWRLIKVQEMLMPIDKAAAPDFDYPTEEQWEYEFRQPDLWLSRDRLRPTMNRATAQVMTGDYDQLTTGPDNQAQSAMAMAVAHSLTTDLNDLSGDFTLSFWLGSMAVFPGVVYQCEAGAGTLAISITQAGGVRSIAFNDGVNGFSRQLSWTGGWVHLAIVRDGTDIRIYENGTQIYTNPMIDSTISYGGTSVVSVNTIVAVFDVRRIARAVSAAALAYYYDQVVNHGATTGFLPVLR